MAKHCLSPPDIVPTAWDGSLTSIPICAILSAAILFALSISKVFKLKLSSQDIDPIFGSMEDFDLMVREAKDKGLRVIMDFVPNHSSNEHEWFLKSEQKEDPYTDYYIWKDRNESNPGKTSKTGLNQI